MILTIVAFVVILSILVLIHELGHFLVAKKLGIKVEEFGIGFPPRVFGIKRGETLYSVNLLPVGGFVKLFGEDAAGGGSIKKQEARSKKQEADIKRAFYARPIWQRFLVVFAGVFMNFVLAVVIISYLFATQGVAIPSDKIHITEIAKNSPAAAAGLLTNDVISKINGEPVTTTDGFISTVEKNSGKPISFTITRNGETFNKSITPRVNPPKGQGAVGVGISDITVKKYKWYEAPFFGTIEAFKFSWIIFSGLGQMVGGLIFQGKTPEGVAGPIGIAQITGEAIRAGLNSYLWLGALLSINLAVLNVLPIPALDGGRLFFIAIEFVTRKKVNPKYEGYAHAVGLAVLLGLMVLITVFDIMRVASGQSLLPK